MNILHVLPIVYELAYIILFQGIYDFLNLIVSQEYRSVPTYNVQKILFINHMVPTIYITQLLNMGTPTNTTIGTIFRCGNADSRSFILNAWTNDCLTGL